MTSSTSSVRSPLVSVIIGAYNAASYVAEAIESVLVQTYRPLEVIVVDDGSTDETGDIIQSFGHAVVYTRQSNAGNGAARNRALELASGGFFAFLDADDRFVEDKLARQYRALQEYPAADMVFGRVREFVSPELTAHERQLIRPPAPAPTPWTAPNLMLIRRDSFHRVGPFSEALRVGVTVDWYARALEKGLRGVMLPDVVLERRLHLSNNGLRERESRNQYLQVLKASLAPPGPVEGSEYRSERGTEGNLSPSSMRMMSYPRPSSRSRRRISSHILRALASLEEGREVDLSGRPGAGVDDAGPHLRGSGWDSTRYGDDPEADPRRDRGVRRELPLLGSRTCSFVCGSEVRNSTCCRTSSNAQTTTLSECDAVSAR